MRIKPRLRINNNLLKKGSSMKHTYLALTMLVSSALYTPISMCICHKANDEKVNPSCLCVQKGNVCACIENTTKANVCPCVNNPVKSEIPCMCVQKGSSCACAESPVKTNISCYCTQSVVKAECLCMQKGNTCGCAAQDVKNSQSIVADISYGELIDKITILEIKMNCIDDKQKLKNIQLELDSLTKTFNMMMQSREQYADEVLHLKAVLYDINQELWNIEDTLRSKEAEQTFDEGFIELARHVYKINDERYAVKRKLNLLLNSPLIEEKSHPAY